LFMRRYLRFFAAGSLNNRDRHGERREEKEDQGLTEIAG
jgi:hypothetical protein